ncbi:hypothetical protein BG006_001022 [Podila minutissima]|uniref:Uncharacterized protein n=1 Tax=Podila minutissima TaxID=64525 RepID=A0A9P5SQ79_9FUNG|nr:hypothetical protein BG006_001022 [Podila minutissima]
MKFISSILMISAALALASAAPLAHIADPIGQVLTKRCADCTNKDAVALEIIVQASADHYSNIAHVRLDNLMNEIQTAKVTSGSQDLPQEKAALTVTVQTKIEEAKKACTPEALASAIKATVAANANMDVPWSKKEEIEKKMVELDIMITKLMLDRIQANIDAERLSKDCTEQMTNTQIAPAPAPEAAPAPAPATEAAPVSAPEVAAPAPAPEVAAPAPAPEVAAPAPAPEVAAPAPAPAACTETSCGSKQAGIDVAADVDAKYVCKSGCKDTQDAKNVLSLRVTLENEFEPRLDHFYNQEVPTDCTKQRNSLLDGVLELVAKIQI